MTWLSGWAVIGEMPMSNRPQSSDTDTESDLLTIAYMDGYWRGKDHAAGRMKSMIDRWRKEASRLDQDAVELARNCRDADAARRLAEAKLRRVLAAELERTLEGKK